MTDDYALRCHGVTKTFGKTRALNGFDLDVRRGQVMALLGPSGCGKTTALRIVAGLETPDGGTVEIGGRLVAGPGINTPPEKRRIGMVFQDFALFPHLNVAANVAYGLAKGASKDRVAQLLALVRLDGLGQRMPHELSGGQQQRVALARALASEPDLILLDEPFSNLDPAVREDVRSEVRQLLRKVGITAVIVTHDQEEALSLSGEVAVMIDGTVMQTGAPAEVYARPANRTVGEFIGAANVIPGTASGSEVECVLGRFQAEGGHGPVDVMFRAESLAVAEDGIPAEIVDIEFYGHDQMITVRLAGGESLRLRLLATPGIEVGKRVGVAVRGEPVVFPRGA